MRTRCPLKGPSRAGVCLPEASRPPRGPSPPLSSPPSGEERCILQRDPFLEDLITGIGGNMQSSLPSYPSSSSWLILTDGPLGGEVDFSLPVQRAPWWAGASPTPLSEKMSQKGFTHPVNPNRWPFPWIPGEVENQPTLSPTPN